MTKLNILRIIDQYSWAYDWVAKDQKKFSKHNIIIKRFMDLNYSDFDDIDVVYMPGPDISQKVNMVFEEVKNRFPNIKIIGAYSGEVKQMYGNIDVLVSISAKYYPTVKNLYPDHPVLWLPECVDTDYWKKSQEYPSNFTLGWCGRPCTVKRPHLLDQLIYPVKRQQNWGREHFIPKDNQDDVKAFYESISALVLTSSSECMPRVVLEAMSMGRPVITTDVGSLRLVIHPDYIVPVLPESVCVYQMNSALEKLQKEQFDFLALGTFNRGIIQSNFSWNTQQEYWDSLYENTYLTKKQELLKIHQHYATRYKEVEPALCV